MLGLSSAIGDPFGNGSVVVAIGVPGEDVDGIIYTLPWKLTQGGAVHLYEIGADGSWTQIARYDSDRRYTRFGTIVMVRLYFKKAKIIHCHSSDVSYKKKRKLCLQMYMAHTFN